jgi:hypothetical protein
MTTFCYFFILYSTKAVKNESAVDIALAPSGRKQQFKLIFYLSLKKKQLEFLFDPGEHSLQVSAKSNKGTGCGVEWVMFTQHYKQRV